MKFSAKLSTVCSALALSGLFLFGGAAQADSVQAQYLSGSSQINNVNVTYAANGANPAATNKQVGGGRVVFDREPLPIGTNFPGTLVANGTPGAVAANINQFVAFCIEPNETLAPNTATYNINGLADAPIAGVNGAMGADRATDMRLLFGHVFPDFSASIDNPNRMALQLAVWEIANEASGNSYSLTAGEFLVNTDNTWRSTAQGWLNILNLPTTDTSRWTIEAKGLMAMTDTQSGFGQDFVVQVVPIPAAAWLFGSALMGTVALGRRKLKKEVEAA